MNQLIVSKAPPANRLIKRAGKKSYVAKVQLDGRKIMAWIRRTGRIEEEEYY
jgi:DNA-binding sugar fermentation-stimulating protein